MIISDIIFNLHMNFKVIHSIPGRMRIHVPVAKKIPAEWQFDNSYFEMAQIIPGIKKIDFSYVTCNALITYDPSLTDEKTIILNMKQVAAIANENKKTLKQFGPDQKDQASEYFGRVIKEHFKAIQKG